MTLWHKVIHPITEHFRRKRGNFLLQEFPDIRSAKICDLGGSAHFWQKVRLDIPLANITIYNVSAAETQSTDSTDLGIKIIIYDGERIPVGDKAFDLLVCNSVLEHVPVAARPAFAKEMQRVAKRIFVQTPAHSFPIEPHFLMPFVHWLPRRLGFQVIKLSPWRLLARPDAATISSYWWDTRLLTRSELRVLFPRCEVVSEKVGGLSKSYYVLSPNMKH